MLYDLIHWIMLISIGATLGYGLGYAKHLGLYAGLAALKLIDVETITRPPATVSITWIFIGIAFGIIFGAVRII